MKVEIWHKTDADYQRIHVLEICSPNDQLLCELAYLYTKEGSVSQIRDSSSIPMVVGDVVVINDTVESRAYEFDDLVGDRPHFRRVNFAH